jgi:hypothetical protein
VGPATATDLAECNRTLERGLMDHARDSHRSRRNLDERAASHYVDSLSRHADALAQVVVEIRANWPDQTTYADAIVERLQQLGWDANMLHGYDRVDETFLPRFLGIERQFSDVEARLRDLMTAST